MKTKIFLFLILICFIGILESCTKAGTGGNGTVICTVSNGINTDKLTNITVYIKYGQSTPPSSNTSGYDNQKQVVSGTVTFTGLNQGTYYLYATGYDTLVNKTTPMTGGAPFSLTHGNSNGTSNAGISVSY